ncbi:hypothetical protein VISI1226_13571 [Vibrio sinaloensis DSM 21326]|uniref:DUF1496 domain-containing protein n=1 Tax=Vibrio sinaloensis DSM 21326 TaxID=945550 RepID=E8M6W0_PHOS4|nr:DUF1496 domain-containing protein [Vibrio sinaloensis]EGA70264.1 hypothetical protein VISI1226_13571 [Vibrio sinaloensis DSM 21326]
MRNYIWGSLFLMTAFGASAEISKPIGKSTVIGVGVNANTVAQRVCYYQDQAYSEGAMLQVGDHIIQCASANDFETNGALKWQPIDKNHSPQIEQTDGAVKRYKVN